MAAAVALGELPEQVALVGQQVPPQRPAAHQHGEQRNIGLSENSRRFLSRLGVWSALESAAVAVRTIHVSEQGVFGVTRIRADEEGVSALGWIVPLAQLQWALYQKVQQQKNVVQKIPASAQSLNRGDNQTMAQLSMNTAEQLSAQLLILADGGQSGLRSAAGFSIHTIDYQQTALVFNTVVSAEMGHCAYERFTKKGLLALLPLGQNRAGVVWVQPTAQAQNLLALNAKQFCYQLHRVIGDRLGAIVEIGRRQLYPLSLQWAQQVCRGRVILLGNAAHSLHPVAAQGLNLSLRDTAFLADHAMRALQDPGRSEHQHNYEQQRQRDSHKVIAFTHGLMRLFALPLGPLRGGMLCGLDLLPPLRRILVRNMLGLKPTMPSANDNC